MSKQDMIVKSIIETARQENSKNLDLWGFDLTEFPEEIFDLKQLKHLYLSGNQLKSIPERISELEDLEILFLDNNELDALPEEIGKLMKLKSLHINKNQLIELPISIGQLAELEILNIAQNEIIELPTELVSLEKLKTLKVDDNPLDFPPMEIAKSGVGSLRNYFQEVLHGGEEIFEAKVLVVGEPGAGKTSLCNKLIDRSYELRVDESITKGIDIFKYSFQLDKEKKFFVNVWDFGGQEIYYATHQFFLTKRSLYLLVSDNRKEDANFDYWLNIIDLLSHTSPLLIVQNEKNKIRKDLNIRAMRERFLNLKDTCTVNLSTNVGLKKLNSLIQSHVKLLPHVGNTLPKTWIRIREILEKDSRNYISEAEYFEICEANGLLSRKRALHLSEYFHDLGIFLHFQKDLILKRILILKPEWGTDAVYKVLNSRKVINNYGKFNASDIEKIWSNKKYKNREVELIQLMLRFELCYRIPIETDQKINLETEYIAPILLSSNQPEYVWRATGNLHFIYRYKFMPKGILPRLIVKINHLIKDRSLVWKEGLVVELNDAHAEVIESYVNREIKIRISGDHRKELLAIIADQIDLINSEYRNIDVEKMVPCNCRVCELSDNPYFFKYKSLLRRIAAGKSIVECDNSYQPINIKALLDGLFGSGNIGDIKSNSATNYKEQLVSKGVIPILNELLKLATENEHLQHFQNDLIVLLTAKKDLNVSIRSGLLSYDEQERQNRSLMNKILEQIDLFFSNV